MHALLLWALALRRLFAGPPLAGPRLVLPLTPFAPGARVELGFQDGGLAVRLVRPTALPAHVEGLDDDLGPHDAWAKF